VEAIPGGPHRPTTIARSLNLNRVIVSKMINAVANPDPLEVLEKLPGPESLRAFAIAAREAGVKPSLVDEAIEAISRFAGLIRQDFGTRIAFNAALSPLRPELKLRLAHKSRYQIYMGMQQVLGVSADTWLTSMIFRPSAEDSESIAVTAIHGALGMGRLRPDARVYFTYGPPNVGTNQASNLSSNDIDLRQFCTHEPAQLETHKAGGQLVHRLAHERLGRHAKVDMLAASHNAKGSRRYASPDRPRGGVVVYPDVPVKVLICDAFLHVDVFPRSTPELMVFNPGARGPANPNDPAREIDRVDVPERIDTISLSEEEFDLTEVPNYRHMMTHVAGCLNVDLSQFRMFRLRMPYPVHGFQFVMAFDAPIRPA